MSTQNQVIQCRAAVAFAPNSPLKIETINVEPPRAGEVRVKVVSTGVCILEQNFLPQFPY